MTRKRTKPIPPVEEETVDLMSLALEEIRRVEVKVDANSVRIEALEALLRRRKLYEENSE